MALTYLERSIFPLEHFFGGLIIMFSVFGLRIDPLWMGWSSQCFGDWGLDFSSLSCIFCVCPRTCPYLVHLCDTYLRVSPLMEWCHDPLRDCQTCPLECRAPQNANTQERHPLGHFHFCLNNTMNCTNGHAFTKSTKVSKLKPKGYFYSKGKG